MEAVDHPPRQPLEHHYIRGGRKIIFCSDKPSLIVFIVFWIGLIIIGCFAIYFGSPSRLIYGYDCFGNTCGMDNSNLRMSLLKAGQQSSSIGFDLRDRPYLFFMDVLTPRYSKPICVSECPTREATSPQQFLEYMNVSGASKRWSGSDFALEMLYYPEHVVASVGSRSPRSPPHSLCEYGVDLEMMAALVRVNVSLDFAFWDSGPCPLLPLRRSAPFFHRCLPTAGAAPRNFTTRRPVPSGPRSAASLDAAEIAIGYINEESKDYGPALAALQQALADLRTLWPQLLLLALVALLLSCVFFALLLFAPRVAIVIIAITALAASLVASLCLWAKYALYVWELNEEQREMKPLLQYTIFSENLFLVMAPVATLFTLGLGVALFSLRRRLWLLGGIYAEAGRSLLALPALLALPPCVGLLLTLIFVVALVLLLYITTSDVAEVVSNPANFSCVKYVDRFGVRWAFVYYVVALIWNSEIVLAGQHFIVAGAASVWYFERQKECVRRPVGRAFVSLVRHHIGSVALGGAILPIVRFPRALIAFCVRRLCFPLWSTNTKSKWLVELRRFLSIHENAFSLMAMRGFSFFGGAFRAQELVAKNPCRVAALECLSDLLVFLAKIAVAALTFVAAFCLLAGRHDIYFYGPVLIVIALFSYFLAHCFFTLYEAFVDALLLCFCEDVEANNGSEGREYYMNLTLFDAIAKGASTLDKLSRKACRVGPHRECGHLPPRPIVLGLPRGVSTATADTAATCGSGALIGSVTEHSLLHAAAPIAEESPPPALVVCVTSAAVAAAAQTAPAASPGGGAVGADGVQSRAGAADAAARDQSQTCAVIAAHTTEATPETLTHAPTPTHSGAPIAAGLPRLLHQESEEGTRVLLHPTPDSPDAQHLSDSPEHLRLYRGSGALGERNDSLSTRAECASATSSSRAPLLTAQTSVMTDAGCSVITGISEAGGGSGGSESAATGLTQLLTPLPSAGPGGDGASPLANCKLERSTDEVDAHTSADDGRSPLLAPVERPDAQQADRNNNLA